MVFELKDGSGSLFKNDKKGNDKAPDYTGSLKVGGKEYRVSAWGKRDKNGNVYFSLSLQDSKPRIENRARVNVPVSGSYRNDGGRFADSQDALEEILDRRPSIDELEDEIPFAPLRKNEIAGW